ncbi:type I phosphomannose isomerase catalytic subunit [Clostridium sp.]|uniref:type I phosphomannose isomerase catalytic subunit n=1 Tax=Clostridium sp. TaxID=1506 RepID=UPI002FC62A98
MYPLKFNNLYYEKIWGGRELEKFRANVPSGNIGESWDVACHEHGVSTVINGEFKGKTLQELIDSYGEKILGNKIEEETFPLLLKIINSKENLSIQVHPQDEYARKVEKSMGKTEAWYVLEAEKGATIVLGTKDCGKDEFHQGIKNDTLHQYINTIEVKKGEVYFIPSGMIHSIGRGITLVEIQENSDITYRVYDYGRGREIHIEKSLDVIDFSLNGCKTNPMVEEHSGYTKQTHCTCSYFALEEYKISISLSEEARGERFYIYTCVEGSGEIISKDYKETISYGESILIPASLGEYKLVGQMKVLKTYVP